MTTARLTGAMREAILKMMEHGEVVPPGRSVRTYVALEERGIARYLKAKKAWRLTAEGKKVGKTI